MILSKAIRNAVRALDEADAPLAERVSARDSELDAEFAAALRQLLTLAMQDQRFLGTTIDTVFVLKGLERIGEHAKQVVFVASGEDVRHKKGTGWQLAGSWSRSFCPLPN